MKQENQVVKSDRRGGLFNDYLFIVITINEVAGFLRIKFREAKGHRKK
jgi:hypothetical protein